MSCFLIVFPNHTNAAVILCVAFSGTVFSFSFGTSRGRNSLRPVWSRDRYFVLHHLHFLE